MTPRKKTAENPTIKKRTPRRSSTKSSGEKANTSSSLPVDSPTPAASLEPPSSPHATGPGVSAAERQRRIAETAYALFLQRGGEHGHALEDWLRAERQIAQEEGRRRQP